jgi:hypothetical protein
MSKKKDSFKPWLSRPTINKSVTLPLTSPLTQRLSNLNEFHPNELDPFLLFDASDSMIGTLENPTLDLDPSKPDTLNVITAVRAGVATYTDESGLIQEATANTVRVDHSLGYPAMLIEPSATNLVTYSEDFTSWTKNDVSLTSGQASPAGDNTATKLTATGGDPWVYTIINTSAQTNTFSFYCRGEGTSIGKTARLLVWYVGSATGTTESFDFTYTSEWQRVEFQTTPTGAGSLIYRIDLPADNSEVDDVAYIWGAQLEAGSVATSYIPTSGSAVTRAADDLTITGSAFSDFYNTSEGTVYVEAVPRLLISGRYLTVSDGTSSNRVILYEGGSLSRLFVSKDGGTQVYLSNTASSINTLNRIAASYKLNNFLTSANGTQAESADTSGTPPTAVNQIAVGRNETGGSQLNGHIKRLIYWPTHSDSL